MLGSIVYVFNTTINTIRKATIIKQNSTLSHIHSKFSFWVLRYNTKRKKKQQNLKFQHFPLFRFQQNKHHNSTIFILNIFFYISFQYLGLSEKPNRESKLTKKKKKLSLPPNQLLLCESTGSDSDQPENPLAVESDPTNGPSLRRRSTPFSFLASS